MNIYTLTLIAIVVFTVFYIWSIYNKLATGKVRIKEALSSIDVQLKRRIDLIPNLVETVKGYAKHEKSVFENVTKARSALMSAKTVTQKAESNNMLSDAIKSLFAVAESYPKLEASKNFVALQEELSDTENKIAYSRQFYNSVVRDYNTILVNFPSAPIGRMFGFVTQDFFAATEAEKKPVAVKF